VAELAILGGQPEIPYPLASYRSHGEEERLAALETIDSGVLSQFLGAAGDLFKGGPRVQHLEQMTAEKFDSVHAVSFNSWTSGLISAIGALQLEPGDEVIVPTWTMAASATAAIHWGCIPVFADIDEKSFNISTESIEERISARTRAIMSVDIFGQPADMDEINSIAKRLDLRVVSDSAQAPGAVYKGRFAGTLSDIGGYSLNYHKHIHCGEGGIAFTQDPELAYRMQLIRNHGEAVVTDDDPGSLANTLGFNFRMGEIEAAIALEQFKKLGALIADRQRVANQLNAFFENLGGVTPPFQAPDRSHVYYVYGLTLDPDFLGVSRDVFAAALGAEGVPVMRRYQNIHLLPMFQHRVAIGSKGFPWSVVPSGDHIDYRKGTCPTAEDLNNRRFLGIPICSYQLPEADVRSVERAFLKVWESLERLRDFEQSLAP